MGRTRIALVDDHKILVDAVSQIVGSEFDVVGTFDDGNELIDKAPSLKPDIVVLDVGMPQINGFAVGRKLKKLLPKIKLIYLTMYQDRESAAEAFQLGASGYVLKNAAAKELITALREVARGGYYASPVLTEGMFGSFVQAFKKMKKPHELTKRQKEILQLLSEGNSMKDVASMLNITPRTVAFHKYSIMETHGIKSNAELLSFALSNLPSSR